MKKILQIVDTYDWAIGSLAKSSHRVNPHFEWRLLAIHPKDLEQGKVDLKSIKEDIAWADLIDAEYWRTLSQLLDMIPELKDKKIVLMHHNEKNLLSYDWPPNVAHAVGTKYSEQVIKDNYPNAKVYYVQNSFDHRIFKYNTEYPPKEPAVGYVGRVVPWKGLKEIAKACFELNYPLQIMGKMDKPSYFAEIPEEHKSIMRWDWFNCKDEERPDFYKNISVYVGNSGGGREIGPLGLIEAMACGVPVVTTPAGIAADIGEHDKNMLIVDYDDYDGLKEAIKTVMEYPAIANRLRRVGWETIRNLNDDRRGLRWREIYNDLLYEKNLVSVIIPTTFSRNDETIQILDALEEQTYKNIEAVVIYDDEGDLQDLGTVGQIIGSGKYPRYSFCVKTLITNKRKSTDYNLALARNLGVIEADGRYIMLNDSRLKPEPEAVKEMLKALLDKKEEKGWVFGSKGAEKTTFVENFSMISRQHLIDGGMFNERINEYGGMSQEIRSRFSRQGFAFGYVPTAMAVQMCKSSLSQERRDGIINMKNLLYKLGLTQ